MAKKECPHCKFMEEIGDNLTDKDKKNRTIYYILTEVFVYLHNGKAYCDYKDISK